MYDYFLKQLQLESSKIFLKNSQLSFLEFRQRVLKASHALQAYELASQNLVVVDIENPQVFITVVFALLNRGLIPCLWNRYFSKEQEALIFETNHYTAFVSDYHTFPGLLELDLKKILAHEHTDDFHLSPDLTLLFYTSGTVQPKACVLTLGNLLYNAQGSLDVIPFATGDTWGLCLPHFHVGGFSTFIRAVLSRASVESLDIETSSEITHLSLVPTQLQRIVEKNQIFPKLRHCLIGGSAISEKLVRDTYRKYPLHLSYGMTEMGSQVATTPILKQPDTAYQILKYRQVEIQNGCVAVGGDCLFRGYLEQQKISTPFVNGLFLTQDLGTLEQGQLKLQGRRDRIFQSAGENISCDFIEHTLANIPGVVRVRIEAEEDSEYGKVPVAYIELKGITELDLQKALQILPGLMRPKRFYSYVAKSWKS